MNKLNFYSLLRCILIVFCFSGSLGYAQNLVPNPTFSNSEVIATINYPSELQKDIVVPKDWEIVSGYPDFFNNSSSTYLGYSLLNSEEESGGKLGMRMATTQNELEAVETRLKSELIAGKTYKVSFTMVQSQYSNFSMNMIPFILSNEKVTESEIFKKQDQQLYYLETKQNYLATDGWVTVSCYYRAYGGEQFLTLLNNSIGIPPQKKSQYNRLIFNFSDNQLENASYYLFNNISIESVENVPVCNPLKINSNLKLLENDSKETLATKFEFLGNKGIIDWDDKKMVQDNLLLKHHIFLIDISGSMDVDFIFIKRNTLAILEIIPANQLISLVVFKDESTVVCVQEKKEDVINSVKELFAAGKTNLDAGLVNMNGLITENEPTVLHIFTDELDGASDYMLRNKSRDFINTKRGDYYLEYESIFHPLMMNTNSVKTHIIDSLYKNKNFEDYIRWKMLDINNFYYSKECSEDPTKDVIVEKSNILKATNYVYLIDVSSSMNEDHKLDQLKKSIIENNTELNISNKVSLVSFSSTTNVLLNSMPMNDESFNTTIQKLEAKGSTKINDGIKYIYNHYGSIEHENVSFILFTDGLFVLSDEAEKIILSHPKIHLTIFQFGDKKNKHLEELTENNSLRYRKIAPKKIKENLKLADKEFGFPSQYSEPQPEIWKFFQKHLLEITGYHD